ncbi:MAG TPA: hypothetical protein PL009_09365 [Flavipsychrobacter sp.]|nr:hypothetical protein [Flavipsychrobacter sp.]
MKSIKLLLSARKIAGIWVSFVFAMLFILSACTENDHPKVDQIEINLQTQRLDQDIADIDTNNVADGLQKLKEKYPDFLDFYLDTLMGFGIQGNYTEAAAGIQLGLKPFLAHKDIRGLFDTVQKHFPDTKQIEQQLVKGFQFMKHYYPDYRIPKLIYFISGLNHWSVMTLDTTLIGIGLDMYLGDGYPFYSAVQIPQYVVRKCKPEYIAANTFQTIYREKHPFVMEDKNLLDLIIQRGKEQSFLNKIIPHTPDSIRFGFTQAQLNWCDANEPDIYNFFITKNLLFETSPNKVHRFVFDGPTTAGMPPESPGNIGSWLGYKIVTAFVAQHAKISLQELLAKNDAQKILQESKYKPK